MAIHRTLGPMLVALLYIPATLGDNRPIVYEEAFDTVLSAREFVATDPAAWRINEGTLELFGSSDYSPPHRSPRNIAFLRSREFGAFTLDLDIMQTGREYGHRDTCLFFGFQDPANFYYVHMASVADDHAHNVFVVDDAARTKIASRTTEGVDWGTGEWHHIRLERSVDPPSIRVFFDDMDEPIMEATDDRFLNGYIGVGSFDDTGRFDNVRVTSNDVTPGDLTTFEQLTIDPWIAASVHAKQAQDAWRRSHRYLNGWLAHRDEATGLIPRNLTRDRFWNAEDAAADNYPFMVLAAWFTDRDVYETTMRDMLRAEIAHSSRVGHLPDAFSFETQAFVHDEIDMPRLIFGASEYVKDGLLPLTDYLGETPWSTRMYALVDDIWANAPINTPAGLIPSRSVEVNGELLQVLTRLFWMSGDDKYLDYAVRLGDYYLLGTNHPTRDFARLRLRDHGCEIVSGLAELYATCRAARPDKAAAYKSHVHDMLDRILEVGRNQHGMFFNEIDPMSGRVLNDGIADTWGYNANAFYTVYMVDGVTRYRDAALEPMRHLDLHYRAYPWEGRSADGYADSIEGAINLVNREPVPSIYSWIDREIQVMFDKQRDDGVIEGWHGDGNFTRTTLMYMLWKTQGVTAAPWPESLRIGAVCEGDSLYLVLETDSDYWGFVSFERHRHADVWHLPMDYPRINQFPEWWVPDPETTYRITGLHDREHQLQGADLLRGVEVRLEAGRRVRVQIEPVARAQP